MTRTAVLAALLLASATGLAQAQPHDETTVITTAGLWSAYSGNANGGHPVCGVTTVGGDGRRIQVQQFAGDNGVDVVLTKDSWRIPPNTPVDLRVQFDLDNQIPSRAVGDGQRVTLHMEFQQSVPFMRALRNDRQIRVFFASGNEAVWTGGLAGSGRAIDAFNDCRARATAPQGPTQPFQQTASPPPAPPAPAAPTQPFANPAVEPTAPQPTAPDPASLPPIPPAPQ